MKKLMSLVLILTLILSGALPVFANSAYEIQLSLEDSILQGGTLTYSGQLTLDGAPVLDHDLSMVITDSNGQVVSLEQFNTGGSGTFSGTYSTTVTAPIGEYKVSVAHSASETLLDKTFEVLAGAALSTISTDKSIYRNGDYMTVTGVALENGVPASDRAYSLLIKDSNDFIKYTEQVQTDANGIFTKQIFINAFATGNYKVVIRINEYDAVANFTIGNIPGPPVVTPTNPPVVVPGPPANPPSPPGKPTVDIDPEDVPLGPGNGKMDAFTTVIKVDEETSTGTSGETIVKIVLDEAAIKEALKKASDEGDDKLLILLESVSPDQVEAKIPTSILVEAAKLGISLAIGSNEVEIVMPAGSIDTTGITELLLTYEKTDIEQKMTLAEAKGLKHVTSIYDLKLINTADNKTVTFNKPLDVRFWYDKSKTNNPMRLGIYHFDTAKEDWSYVGGRVDVSEGWILTKLSHFSLYTVLSNNAKFDDLHSNHWAISTIDQMVARNIMSGVGGNKFAPERQIKRSEFVAMLVNTLNLKETDIKVAITDIEGKWYEEYVKIAAMNGLVDPVGAFDPESPITREDMAVMLSKALQYSNVSNPDNFETSLEKFGDTATISEAKSMDVANVAAHGLFNGISGDFVPLGKATRAQAAAVITKLLEILEIY